MNSSERRLFKRGPALGLFHLGMGIALPTLLLATGDSSGIIQVMAGIFVLVAFASGLTALLRPFVRLDDDRVVVNRHQLGADRTIKHTDLEGASANGSALTLMYEDPKSGDSRSITVATYLPATVVDDIATCIERRCCTSAETPTSSGPSTSLSSKDAGDGDVGTSADSGGFVEIVPSAGAPEGTSLLAVLKKQAVTAALSGADNNAGEFEQWLRSQGYEDVEKSSGLFSVSWTWRGDAGDIVAYSTLPSGHIATCAYVDADGNQCSFGGVMEGML